MKKTFGYARISTKAQNLDTQIESLQKYGVDRIFEDKFSGRSKSRPALDDMLSQLRKGDTVVVSKFTRIGRNTVHIISLIQQFAKEGILFVALDLGIDTSTPMGRFFTSVMASLAELQLEIILENTLEGRMIAKAKGKHMGRKAGVDKDKFNKVKVALKNGMSISEVVAVTGVSISSVKRYKKIYDGE